MSQQRQKRIRAVRELCKTKGIRVFHESQYPNPGRIARVGGRRVKGTQTRVQDRLANGVIYHMPHADGWMDNGVLRHNDRLYLLHFGEPADEIELALAQLKLFNPTKRTEIFVLICQGERP